MDGSSDELNATQWLAVLFVLLVLLVPLAVALAAWFKRRYARAVVHLQSTLAGAAPAADEQGRDAAAAPPPLRIVTLGAASVTEGSTAAAPARRLRRRVLAVQFAAGLLYWWILLVGMAVALTVWQQMAGTEGDSSAEVGAWSANAVIWPLLVLPAALGWLFQAGLRERTVWVTAAASALLLGVGLAGAGIGVVGAGSTALVLALLAAMLAAFLRPAVRGAGPPLVAALTVALGVFSVLAAIVAAFDDPADTAPTTAADAALAAGALALLLAASLWVAWRVLLRLSRRYAAKRFSEMQLALGAYWGLITAFAAAAVLLLSFEERTGASMEWLGAGIALVWLLWRWLQRMALWWARRGAAPALGALLMLRVFKPSQRSEAFTDRFLARWRFAAPVWMIAGPDLAGAYMEPDEFFAFLGRRLRERFIADAADIPARLAALDGGRDPDGRFRVNELFCSNSTWKPAVRALIRDAGVVLLDLREYHAARAGTRFELEQVLREVPLHKVVIVVGADDTAVALQEEIQAAWSRAGGGRGGTGLRLLQVASDSGAELEGLFRAAAAAAG